MLDDFREQADGSLFSEEEAPAFGELPPVTKREFFGMSPAQRFVISLMLLFLVVLLSVFCLLVTGKVALPI
jgi:hypothetical protein